MKTIRRFLAFPVFALGVIAGGVGLFFGWLHTRFFPWLRAGTMEHAYWPLVQAHRVVKGVPRWQPMDLLLGKQPRTDADRKVADEHPDVVKQQCMCTNPECPAKSSYSYMPGGKEIMQRAQRAAANPEAARFSFDALPAPIRDQALATMRKVVGYDEIAAEREQLAQLAKINEKVIENDRQLLEQNQKVIEADARVIENQKRLIAELEVELAARDARIADLDAKFNDLEQRVRAFQNAHASSPLN